MRRHVLVLGTVATLLAGGIGRAAAPASTATTIYRDTFGVAHIEAPTLQSASYAMGYATAQDRLFEMDIFRKLGQGRLSEFVGPPMLPMDELIRREFVLPGRIDAQYRELDPTVRAMLDAYTRGINDAALKTYADPRTRPALYDVLAMPWEPWTPQDSVTVAVIFASDLFGGDGAAGELSNAATLHDLQRRYGTAVGLQMFNDVYPATFADAPTIIAPGEGPAAPPAGTGYDASGPAPAQLPAINAPGVTAAAQAQASALALVKNLLRSYHIPVPHLGSFGAAIAGSRTVSHGGLLMGSPQAGLESPPIFYEIGYHIAGVTDCEGTTVPGLGPLIAIGWCNQHAWTLIAANVGDQADLYAERLDPANPHRYYFDGGWRDTVQRTTTYIIKGVFTCTKPCPPQIVTRTYDYTVHGAIGIVDAPAHLGFAYRRAQTGIAARNITASIAENMAHTYAQFRDGLDRGTATLHLLYADASGLIAYRFTGLQPIRPGFDRRFPMPGTGEAEWHGFLSACQMPSVVDPAAGYLAVNQGTESKPISWWPNSSLTGIGVVARPRYDQQLLATLPPDTLEIQRQLEHRYLMEDDPEAALFYPLFAHALAGSSDPSLRAALAQLDAWRADGFRRTDRSGHGVEDHPGLAIFEMDHYDEYGTGPAYPTPLGDVMVTAAFGAPIGATLPGNTAMAKYSAIYDALTHRLSRDYVGDTDAFIRAAVAKVVHTLSDSHHFATPDMSRWHVAYPKVAFTAIGLESPPPIKGFDHGSYSQIVDLGIGSGENVEPAGNVAADSLFETVEIAFGAPPPHYMDQWAMYQSYVYKPMRMRAAQYRAHTESVTVLDPPGSFGATTRLPPSGRDPCRR
ncbi:MAG: penicillin acylase family protein [Acidimicrobiales bacterium]